MAVIITVLMFGLLVLMKILVGAQNMSGLRSGYYRRYDVTPTGCQNVSGPTTRFQCAITCTGVFGCNAFIFQDKICKICPGEQMTNLMFSSEQCRLRIALKLSERTVNVSNGALVYLSKPLTPGAVIYLSTTVSGPKLSLDFEKAPNDPTSIIFHFSIDGGRGQIVMNNKINDEWQTEEFGSYTFPFGARTDIFFLLTTDRFLIYTDKVFCCQFMYRMPLTDVHRFCVGGNIQVHEFSF